MSKKNQKIVFYVLPIKVFSEIAIEKDFHIVGWKNDQVILYPTKDMEIDKESFPWSYGKAYHDKKGRVTIIVVPGEGLIHKLPESKYWHVI